MGSLFRRSVREYEAVRACFNRQDAPSGRRIGKACGLREGVGLESFERGGSRWRRSRSNCRTRLCRPRSRPRNLHASCGWSRVPGTPYLIELNHFADGQGKQGHEVSLRAKGATHVPWVPESGWPLVCGFLERISSSHCAIRTTLRQLGLFQSLLLEVFAWLPDSSQELVDRGASSACCLARQTASSEAPHATHKRRSRCYDRRARFPFGGVVSGSEKRA